MKQANFKSYYDSYWKDFRVDEEKYNEIMSTWLEFRKIILEKDMTPERYNGSDEMLTGDKCKCSLRKFLEWESTKGFFGELGPMVSGRLCLFPTIKDDKKSIYYKGKEVEGTELKIALKK